MENVLKVVTTEDGFVLVTDTELVVVEEVLRFKRSDVEIVEPDKAPEPVDEEEIEDDPEPEDEGEEDEDEEDEDEEDEDEEDEDEEDEDEEDEDDDEEWTMDELKELDRDALKEVIEDEELDIDPDDYKSTKKLRAAIAEELGID